MSHSPGMVRFDDSLIMHCEYDGTNDIMQKKLYPTRADMIAAWRTYPPAKCECGRDEHVVIATNYGPGIYWDGMACRHCQAITSNISWLGDNCPHNEGLVDWW